MTGFLEMWLEAVERNNSVLCAGIDPADFEMGREDKGLPKGINKADYVQEYMMAVGPFVAAFKPNAQFWQGEEDAKTLKLISQIAAQFKVPVIQDRKLADIGDTNDAGIFYTAKQGAQAVTLAPYAGNMAQSQTYGTNRNVGIITMCLMSNPEYAREKNKLVPIGDDIIFRTGDIRFVEGDASWQKYVPQYIYNAAAAAHHGLAGIVVGAPSKNNHITDEEIGSVRHYSLPDTLVLMPGVGKQGGDESSVWRHFGANRVIVNVGSDLLLAKDHGERARFYQNRFNEGRRAA